MKKLVSVLFVFLLVAVSFSFAQNPDRSKWPAKLVHPDMPAYKTGKFKGWNYWDKSNTGSLFMLIENTTQADLDKYKGQLKAAGFEEKDSDTYHKGLFDVRLQFNTKTTLQISSSKIKTMEWPKKLLVGIPEQKKGALTNIIEPSEDMPDYVQLYFINLSREELEAWFQALKKVGFEIDGHSASKSKATLKGKSYASLNIQAEDNGPNEWMVDFNFSDCGFQFFEPFYYGRARRPLATGAPAWR